jgi:hypothetical protein
MREFVYFQFQFINRRGNEFQAPAFLTCRIKQRGKTKAEHKGRHINAYRGMKQMEYTHSVIHCKYK